jgi:penicillin-binding protein 1B
MPPSTAPSGVRAALRGWLRRLIIVSTCLALLAFAVWLGYLDYTVRRQFEGQRWELPSHVYARPLEIYAGAALNGPRLLKALEELQYRPDASLSTPATYTRKGEDFLVRSRPFRFWDKNEPSRRMKITLSGGAVTGLYDLNSGNALAIARLDPIHIGSFYPSRKEDRILIKLSDAPPLLVKGLLAMEDRDFYEHYGVSPKAIARAMWANLRALSFVQGGSTVTQQLVKNFYLDSRRTLMRKISEAFMALIVDAHYPKDEILEAYLNEIYLGQDGARAIHGFGLASEFYFSRSLSDLKLQHMAMLVALVRGPGYYDPRHNPERALEHRNLVLDTMATTGVVNQAEAEAAKKQPLDVVKASHHAVARYPAFLDLVRRHLREEYKDEDLASTGLRIFTTLEPDAQQQLEAAIAETVPKLERQHRLENLETAAIITQRANGEVVALAGGRDPAEAGFNRALDAVRPIGSLIKPIVYLTALTQPRRYTTTTPLSDTAIHLKNIGGGAWAPKNYDNKEHGVVPLHVALAESYNLATVRLGLEVGVPQVVKTLRQLGVNRPVDPFPSFLLGAGEMTVMDVAQMYQTLAAEGFVMPLRSILGVLSGEGAPLQRYALTVHQGVDSGPVHILDTLLQEVVSAGTAESLNNVLPHYFNAAGKTGSTNDLRDSWFAGFTGDYAGVVWVGRDDNQPSKLSGARGALPIWANVFKRISREPLDLLPPDGVELVWIDPSNGLRASEACPGARQYPYLAGSAPDTWSACAGAPMNEASPSIPPNPVNEVFRELF